MIYDPQGWADADLSRAAHRVGIIVFSHLNSEPFSAYPSIPKIAAALGYTERNTYKAIAELKRAGLLASARVRGRKSMSYDQPARLTTLNGTDTLNALDRVNALDRGGVNDSDRDTLNGLDRQTNPVTDPLTNPSSRARRNVPKKTEQTVDGWNKITGEPMTWPRSQVLPSEFVHEQPQIHYGYIADEMATCVEGHEPNGFSDNPRPNASPDKVWPRHHYLLARPL